MSDIHERAAELTAQVGQTKEYRKWLCNLRYACAKVRLMRDERGLPRETSYNTLVDMEQWATGIAGKCDDWLDENEYKLSELMGRIVDNG